MTQKRGWRRWDVILLSTVLIAGCTAYGPPATSAGREKPESKLVLCHWMPVMCIGAECTAGEGPLAQTPSMIPNGMMALHAPECLANYRLPLPAARQDIAMAKAAGVTAFSCCLGNDYLPNSQFASMLCAAFDAAQEDCAFTIAPDIWGSVRTPGDITQLATALGLIKDHHDRAWRRHHGKRLVLLWADYGNLTDDRGRPLPYRETVDALFSRIGGRESVFLVLYSPVELKRNNPDWFAGADGFTQWDIPNYGAAIAARSAAAACAAAAGREFLQPVMPAFQQSRNWPSDFQPNVREKLGMVNFAADWRAAIEADAPAVFIQTWNDLTEDSALMPESNHGRAYCELNQYYARWFTSGRAPSIEKEQVLLFHHPQVVDGLLLPPGRSPMGTLDPERSTPPTDYVGVVGMFKQPTRVVVQFGEKVLGETEFPAGMNAWLLYHPQEKQGGLHANATPVYPAERPGLSITTLPEPFRDTEVYVFVYRGTRRVGVFRSHRPIAGAAGRGELPTIGDVFDLQP